MRAYECIYTTRRRAVLGTPTHAQETFSIYSRNSRQPPPPPPSRLLCYRVHRALRRRVRRIRVCVCVCLRVCVCVRACVRACVRVCTTTPRRRRAAVVQYLVLAIPTIVVGPYNNRRRRRRGGWWGGAGVRPFIREKGLRLGFFFLSLSVISRRVRKTIRTPGARLPTTVRTVADRRYPCARLRRPGVLNNRRRSGRGPGPKRHRCVATSPSQYPPPPRRTVLYGYAHQSCINRFTRATFTVTTRNTTESSIFTQLIFSILIGFHTL